MAEPVPFARGPGDINQGGYLDFSTRAGISIYQASIKSLYGTQEEYFDLQSDGLTLFLNNLDSRAMEFGWHNDVLVLEDNPNDIGGDGTYFLDSHGTFTLEHVQTIERHYNATETRTAQNSLMLAKCLLNSLTSDAIQRINNRKDDWVLNVPVAGNEIEMQCGVCLLKVILIISQQETRSTMSFVLKQLSDLTPLMLETDYNIESFHIKVNELINKVRKANRQVPESLLISLFTAYKSVPDEHFIRFIETKKDRYTDEGMELNPDTLMHAAEQKYYDLTHIDKTWRTPSEAEKKIAALSTTVSTLQRKLKGKKSEPSGGAKKDPTKSGTKLSRPEWLRKQIKPHNVNITREWNGKVWRYCCPESGGKCKGKWVTHKAKDCVGEDFRAKRNPSREDNKQKTKKQKTTVAHHTKVTSENPTQELQAALAAAHHNANQDDDE